MGTHGSPANEVLWQAIVKFNLMAPAAGQTYFDFSHAKHSRRTMEARHVQYLDKDCHRTLDLFGGARRFICEVRGWSGIGKCADQRNCAGARERRWNEQCDGRSERHRQRLQGRSAAGAAHLRPGGSALQVRLNAGATTAEVI